MTPCGLAPGVGASDCERDFLGLIAYILGEVAGNEGERAKVQGELISKLVTDIRDCRQGPKPTSWTLDYPASELGP